MGLPSDAAYLGAELAPSLAQILTVPPPFEDLPRWRVGTLAHLARRSRSHADFSMEPDVFARVAGVPAARGRKRLRTVAQAGDVAAAERVARALATPDGLVRHLWPNLQAVSMWMDGASAPYAARVGELLPGVHLDGKGVLATESVLTVRQSTRLRASPRQRLHRISRWG